MQLRSKSSRSYLARGKACLTDRGLTLITIITSLPHPLQYYTERKEAKSKRARQSTLTEQRCFGPSFIGRRRERGFSSVLDPEHAA